jgi:RNA polymerase sigma factor (sigma-70 family)
MFLKKLQEKKLEEGDEILISKWKKTKDENIINELIKRHISLIHHMASGYQKNGLAMHDLVAEGILGLIHSVEKFRVEEKTKFSTYAHYWIRAKINMYVWKMKNIIHVTKSKKNSFIYSLIYDINEEKISKEEAIKKIASREGISLKKAKDSLNLLKVKMKSLNEKLNYNHHSEDKDVSIEDLLTNNDHEDMMEEINQKDIMNLIKNILMSMTEKQRILINERWLTESPKTLKELGDKFNMSTEGIRRMEIRTIESLREGIGSKKSNYHYYHYLKV